jgi:hypothetical protein
MLYLSGVARSSFLAIAVAASIVASVAVAETPATGSDAHVAFQHLMQELEQFPSVSFKDISAEVCSKYTSSDLDAMITYSNNAEYSFFEAPRPGVKAGDRVWRFYDGLGLTSYRSLSVVINDGLQTCAAWVRAMPIAF